MTNKIYDSGAKIYTRQESRTGCRCICTEKKITSNYLISCRSHRATTRWKPVEPRVNERMMTSRPSKNDIAKFSKALSPVISHATTVTQIYVHAACSWEGILLWQTIFFFYHWRVFLFQASFFSLSFSLKQQLSAIFKSISQLTICTIPCNESPTLEIARIFPNTDCNNNSAVRSVRVSRAGLRNTYIHTLRPPHGGSFFVSPDSGVWCFEFYPGNQTVTNTGSFIR